MNDSDADEEMAFRLAMMEGLIHLKCYGFNLKMISFYCSMKLIIWYFLLLLDGLNAPGRSRTASLLFIQVLKTLTYFIPLNISCKIAIMNRHYTSYYLIFKL